MLRWLPVAKNAALVPVLGHSPIRRVLRSKGYMWMSNSHATALFWSHAGQHFEIREENDWCGFNNRTCRPHILLIPVKALEIVMAAQVGGHAR